MPVLSLISPICFSLASSKIWTLPAYVPMYSRLVAAGEGDALPETLRCSARNGQRDNGKRGSQQCAAHKPLRPRCDSSVLRSLRVLRAGERSRTISCPGRSGRSCASPSAPRRTSRSSRARDSADPAPAPARSSPCGSRTDRVRPAGTDPPCRRCDPPPSPARTPASSRSECAAARAAAAVRPAAARRRPASRPP